MFEAKVRRRDGQTIDVEISVASTELDGERVVFAASRDITERKRTEERLMRYAADLVRANQLKDVFTGRGSLRRRLDRSPHP